MGEVWIAMGVLSPAWALLLSTAPGSGVVRLSSSHLGTSLGAGGWGSVSESFKPFWNVTASSCLFLTVMSTAFCTCSLPFPVFLPLSFPAVTL
jgi:hypothetical protein